jgi:hypothetical protein
MVTSMSFSKHGTTSMTTDRIDPIESLRDGLAASEATEHDGPTSRTGRSKPTLCEWQSPTEHLSLIQGGTGPRMELGKSAICH